MTIKIWNIEKITGYKPITTFYEDFSIADNFGEEAIRDTFKRAFKHWKDNYKYLTELVMVLNWKMWAHYDENNQKLTKLYHDLWEVADDYACNHLKDDELLYFYRTTD